MGVKAIQANENRTLGTALPAEMTRVRDELLPEYDAIGSAGAIGAMFLRQSLNEATIALAEGDVVAMLRCYEFLKGAC